MVMVRLARLQESRSIDTVKFNILSLRKLHHVGEWAPKRTSRVIINQYWFEKHNANVQPHHHFFPQFLGRSEIKWENDLGNGHIEAVRQYALTLGKATTPEEAKAFTTTSVCDTKQGVSGPAPEWR